MIAGICILFLRSDTGPMSVVTGNTAGGVLLRRVGPPMLVVPTLIGWLTFQAVDRDLLSVRAGFALLVGLITVLGISSLWSLATQLRVTDLRRAGAEQTLERVREAEAAQGRLATELRASEHRIRAIIDSMLDAYIAVDHARSSAPGTMPPSSCSNGPGSGRWAGRSPR